MSRPNLSLKKYFYYALIYSLVLIFVYNFLFKERDVWKSKNPLQLSSSLSPSSSAAALLQQQQQQNHQQHLEPQNTIGYNHKYDEDDDTDNQKNDDKTDDADATNLSTTKTPQPEGELTESDKQLSPQQQQLALQQQQQNLILASNPMGILKKPWFFKHGDYYPKPAKVPKKRHGKKAHLQGSRLFPYQDPHSDRIVNQLMYVPPNYEEVRSSGKLKTIYVIDLLMEIDIDEGRDVFLRSKCPVDTCRITTSHYWANKADMIWYNEWYTQTTARRPANSKQVQMLYYLECPFRTLQVSIPDAINWTSTYRRDSDIVAPYEKWQYYDSRIHQQEQDRNYAANKTKKVAWFVSNCKANNERLEYAYELGKHIQVDIYGACGNYTCDIYDDKCFKMLDRDYKFYLAFENSNCRDYITEKFFENALSHNILPIVMGARPEDYEYSAPERSYIHVDEFGSARELADYLHFLDKDERLYNSYFQWKGTGEFINTYYWCRVCAALHDKESLKKPRWYTDVNNWWSGSGACRRGSWRNLNTRKDIMNGNVQKEKSNDNLLQ